MSKKEKEAESLRSEFHKMLKEAPPHDYYSYWPGDETRPCVHAFQTSKHLTPYCRVCGYTIRAGNHIRSRETGIEYDYTIKHSDR